MITYLQIGILLAIARCIELYLIAKEPDEKYMYDETSYNLKILNNEVNNGYADSDTILGMVIGTVILVIAWPIVILGNVIGMIYVITKR